MAYTKAQGLSLLRARLDTAEVGGLFGDELADYLIEAQVAVVSAMPDSMLTEALTGTDVKTINATGVVTATMWPKPNDYIRTLGVWKEVYSPDVSIVNFFHVEFLPNANDLRRKIASAHYPDNSSSGGFYALDGGRIWVWPIVARERFVWRYVKIPPTLSIQQGFTTPDYLFEIVVNKAAQSALLQVDKGSAADKWGAKADTQFAELKALWGIKPTPPYIQVPKQV